MSKVLTFGVFDMLHYGHVRLFMRAKCLALTGAFDSEDLSLRADEDCLTSGGKLIVAVQDTNSILKYKPNTKIVYSLDEKMFFLRSIRYIDKVVVYNDVDKDIKNIDFDILVVGPDQCHEGFQRAMQWCRDNGKEVVVIPRTEGISSTMIKEGVK